MDAFGVVDKVLGDYENFVKGFFEIKNDQIRTKVENEIEGGLLWPEPWLALNPAFEPGGTVSDLVEQGVLQPKTRDIFRVRTEQDPAGCEITFHRHQTDAFEIANRPMNALANSQHNELEKFLGTTSPKVTFARYTGQEGRDKREETLQSPPDILLTNYVMLELMLTRPRERRAPIASAGNLSFLVLDELHTYRGRQGADVAMLVRRLRGAVAADAMQCIGTSATLAGPGTKAEQRQQVVELASRIFGVRIPAANIVGETLRRATIGDADPAVLRDRLGRATPTTWEELRTDPLAVWAEQHFGLRDDDEGKLARRSPSKLSDAAQELHDQTGAETQVCRAKLRELLLAGSRGRDAQHRAIGISVRARWFAAKIERAPKSAGIRSVRLAMASEDHDAVRAGTMHRMKGLEFWCVCVAGVSAKQAPEPNAVTPIQDDKQTHSSSIESLPSTRDGRKRKPRRASRGTTSPPAPAEFPTPRRSPIRGSPSSSVSKLPMRPSTHSDSTQSTR